MSGFCSHGPDSSSNVPHSTVIKSGEVNIDEEEEDKSKSMLFFVAFLHGSR